MTAEVIQKKIREYHAKGLRMFITSSFQTHSIPLVHICSLSGVDIDVLFINTGFHFPATLEFRDKICADLKMKLIDVRSEVPKNMQRDSDGNFYFASDPDRCCYINKTQPLDTFLKEYDVWINGIRADQNLNRAKMREEEKTPYKCIRFHPLLYWTAKDIYIYRKEHSLPEHPLEKSGYMSIGCQPCTEKFNLHDERAARWFGLNKTECGLHTDLIKVFP